MLMTPALKRRTVSSCERLIIFGVNMNEAEHFSEHARNALYRLLYERPMLEQLNWHQGKPLHLMQDQWSDPIC